MKGILLVLLLLPAFAGAQIVTTIAGNGIRGFSGDGGMATNAELNAPSDVYKDGGGNIYIADRGNNRVRKINRAGIITTVAGNGAMGNTGDGGPAVLASLNRPNRVVADAAGNILIADEGNNVIRKVDASGIISTIVGTGVPGSLGDGGAASSAQLNDPTGVAVDAAGNIYISDRGNYCIRKVNTANIITTYAGGGSAGFATDGVTATAVRLCGQNYVSVDNDGTVYLTNHDCWHFLKVTTAGLIYNVAGNSSPSYSGDGGMANTANIEGPDGICPDNLGNVYLCAQQNVRVRKVDAQHHITTLAGTGVSGYSGDGGPATDASISSTISGVYADLAGNVYFADMGNDRIRIVTSVNGLSSRGLTVFPNPTTSWLTISAPQMISSVVIYDMLGQVVLDRAYTSEQVQINVSDLAASLYFVKVNGSLVGKFVKE